MLTGCAVVPLLAVALAVGSVGVGAQDNGGAPPTSGAPTPGSLPQYGSVDGAPRRFVTYVYALHDGSARMDGTDDFLRPDPNGATIDDGSQWQGYPVMRPTVDTIDGLPVAGHHTVIALRGEADPAHDGIWELSTDHHGVTGTYAVRTRWWNGTLSGDPTDYLYVQSGTPFLVLNGQRFARTWWVTQGDGLETDVEPVNPFVPSTTAATTDVEESASPPSSAVGRRDLVFAGGLGGLVGAGAVAAPVAVLAARRRRRGAPTAAP